MKPNARIQKRFRQNLNGSFSGTMGTLPVTVAADQSTRDLDLKLIRNARKNKQPMPSLLGTMVDDYEAQLNELELQMALLVAQSEIERQKAEVLANQIVEQIHIAEAEILKFLNSYSKELVDSIAAQVTVSEESLKFKGTDIYDMSFISNMDYSKIKIYNDKSLLQKREDKREVYRKKMVENKKNVDFHMGLIQNTAVGDTMLPDLYNARNYYLREYYLSCIAFYQEATCIGFLMNPTNNLENLKQFIALNDSNIPKMKTDNDAKRLSIGEEAYQKELARIKFIERTLVSAKSRLKYLTLAYEGKWKPPTFETLTEYAEKHNLTYSRTVYDLNEFSRNSLLIPDWILALAEMYNLIEVSEQGSDVVQLNPYNPIWIRKAKAVINLETPGVKSTSEKLFKVIDAYWEVLTGGFQTLEDYHLEAIIIKAKNIDSTPVTGYEITTDYDLVSFDEDQQMGGFFKKVFKAIKSVAKAVVEPVVKVGGVVLKAASPVTSVVTKQLKFVMDNTLGRVLPNSIYDKISGLTNAGASILEGNLTSANFRAVVKGVMDYALIGVRIANEAKRQAMKVGMLENLFIAVDGYSGGLLTSCERLANVPIALNEGRKINWMVVLVDALKVAAAVASGGTAVAIMVAVNAVGDKTGLDQSSLGRGILTAGAMIAAGQATFNSQLASGAAQIGTKAALNNTNLGDSSLGRAVVEIGVTGAVNSVQANTAFSQEIRDRAEAKIREVAKAKANAELRDATGLPINVDMLDKAYDFATGDKTIESVISDARKKFDEKYAEIENKIKNFSAEDLKDKANAEMAKLTPEKIEAEASRFADKFVEDQLQKAKDKYGQKLFDYLLAKYGPKFDFDDVATPDDYLNYQIYERDPDKRIINIVYKSNTPKVVMAVIGIGALSFFAME